MGGQRRNLIYVIIGSCQYNGSTGSTNGIGAKAIIEAHSLFSNTINMRCFVDNTVITTHGVRCMVIGHNKNNVWTGIWH
jgi:hypothetical protein